MVRYERFSYVRRRRTLERQPPNRKTAAWLAPHPAILSEPEPPTVRARCVLRWVSLGAVLFLYSTIIYDCVHGLEAGYRNDLSKSKKFLTRHFWISLDVVGPAGFGGRKCLLPAHGQEHDATIRRACIPT